MLLTKDRMGRGEGYWKGEDGLGLKRAGMCGLARFSLHGWRLTLHEHSTKDLSARTRGSCAHYPAGWYVLAF